VRYGLPCGQPASASPRQSRESAYIPATPKRLAARLLALAASDSFVLGRGGDRILLSKAKLFSTNAAMRHAVRAVVSTRAAASNDSSGTPRPSKSSTGPAKSTHPDDWTRRARRPSLIRQTRRDHFRKTAASDATLPLPEICVRALEGRLELERRFRSQAEAWHESGLVITTKLGKPVDPRTFYRAFQTRCRRAGVPTTTVHATRKACASLLIAVDIHPRGGHADTAQSQITVTMDVNSQVTSDSTLRALKALGERLEGH
jgi:hypothetical protein